MFDLLVFIGRFQPFHNEHQRIIDEALTRAKNVLVLIGSSGRARSTTNPFTYEERSDMILQSYPAGTPLYTDALHDHMYDDEAWVNEAQGLIKEVAFDIVNDYGFRNHGLEGMKIGIIGAKKDDSSFYLDMFPEYELVEIELKHVIHATDIRESYLLDDFIYYNVINETVTKFLDDFAETEEYANLQDWMEEVEHDRDIWANAIYPVIKQTADNFVVNGDKILLIERKHNPGKGQLALPGGYVNPEETIRKASVRELEEETGLVLHHDDIVAAFTYDHPNRSTMGRVITSVAVYDNTEGLSETPVEGLDDAAKAEWYDIDKLQEEWFFDDHYFIIKDLLTLGGPND